MEEIDLLSVDGNSVLIGSCMWTSDDVSLPVLIERAELLSQAYKWFYLFSEND